MNKKAVRFREKGFSVVELLIVLTILTAIALIALPDYINTVLPKHKIKAAAREVMTDMRYARMRSVSRNLEYRIRFIPASESYVIESGNESSGSTAWNQEGTIRNFSDTSNPHFHEGVTIDNVLLNNPVVYKPTGEVSRTQVVLSHPKAGTWQVSGSIAGRVNLSKTS